MVPDDKTSTTIWMRGYGTILNSTSKDEKNGTHFRDTVLIPALMKYEHVKVNFRSVEILSNEFIMDAFGTLPAKGYEYDVLADWMLIVSPDHLGWIDKIWNAIGVRSYQ